MCIIRKSVFFTFIFSLVILFTSCESELIGQYLNKPERVFLDNWEYTLDGENYTPLELRFLEKLYRKIPGRKGYITLRTKFTVPDYLENEEVAINFGSVYIAAKFFINDKQVYSVGYFPPKAFTSGKQTHCVRIPENALEIHEPITLSITFWIDGSGGMTGVPFISSYYDVSLATQYQSFILSKIYFAFAVFGILAMICFYSMYLQNKKEREYMSFALINICTALFLYPYYVNEIPGVVGIIGMLRFSRFFKGIMVLAVAYYDACFVRDFLKYKESKKIYWIRVAFFLVPCICIDLTPNLVIYYMLQHLIFIFAALQLIFVIKPILWAWKSNRAGLKVLFIGFAPVLTSFGADVVVHGFLRCNMLPLFTMYGWQFTILTFLVIVSTRYAKFRKEAEYLNAQLEKEVNSRTLALTKANEELEKKNYQAVCDMELASHVQKAFYPQSIDFFGWDIGLRFEPLSGVSGDIYDFYLLEGQLRGFVLFDVSGHGISSGLVTMLAKNTIFHEFRTTLPLDLSEAMLHINNSVIRVKGGIENYLTGVVCRIDKDDPSQFEISNAGAPYPVYKAKNAEKATLITPDRSKPQYGMIGVEGLSVCFQSIKVTMNVGDVLVLYTDGLTETENSKGEQYSNERIQNVLNTTTGTAQEILDAINLDFKEFVGANYIDDDITVIVIKRTEESDIELEELDFVDVEELDE